MSEKTGLFTRNKEFIEQNSEKSVISSLLQLTSYTKKKIKIQMKLWASSSSRSFLLGREGREGSERRRGGGGEKRKGVITEKKRNTNCRREEVQVGKNRAFEPYMFNGLEWAYRLSSKKLLA